MNEVKELSIEEVHAKLLNIAVIFDKICRRHGIQYYMIYGTLLGAVRHKGFIPWDDDMDFGVPRSMYSKLETVLKEEIAPPYRVITHKNAGYPLKIIKIEDTTTWVDDLQRQGKPNIRIGINIDIFPMEECSNDSKRVVRWIKKNDIENIKVSSLYLSFVHSTWWKSCIRLLIKVFYSHKGTEYWIKRNERIIDGIHKTGNDAYMVLTGFYGEKDVISKTIYGTPNLYEFSGVQLYGPALGREFLKQIYGDNYMELPPENERRTHSSKYFELMQ